VFLHEVEQEHDRENWVRSVRSRVKSHERRQTIQDSDITNLYVVRFVGLATAASAASSVEPEPAKQLMTMSPRYAAALDGSRRNQSCTRGSSQTATLNRIHGERSR
jgi:hypothetical protein